MAKVATDKQNETTLTCLMHALADVQQTIRAYDTKSEILGVLLTLAIGITNFTRAVNYTGTPKTLLAISSITGLVAIIFIGLVLSPRRNLFKKVQLGNYTPSATYFVTDAANGPQHSIPAFVTRALATDWVSELTYEALKLSLVRDYKHLWFRWALWVAGGTFLLIALAVGLADLCNVK
ncbi:MAG TPA: hypothetical protein VIE65_20580 [Methylobacter sp.]|jgi:hypothetical protein